MLPNEILGGPTQHTVQAEMGTRLIMLNYISFEFKNPLKERIALAAGRCLPTHRVNRGLSCRNYVTLPWAAAGSRGAPTLGPPTLRLLRLAELVWRRPQAMPAGDL